MNDALNKSLISAHEGLRLKVYRDSRWFRTIGRGFNLDSLGAGAVCAAAGTDYLAVMAGGPITLEQADAIFDSQYKVVAAYARRAIPRIDEYPDNAGAVVCDMIFELGFQGFMGFRNALAGLLAKDWAAAIAAMRASQWAMQVPGRAANDIALLEALAPQPGPAAGGPESA